MCSSSTDVLDKVIRQAKFSDVFASNVTYICGQNVDFPCALREGICRTPHVALLLAWSLVQLKERDNLRETPEYNPLFVLYSGVSLKFPVG